MDDILKDSRFSHIPRDPRFKRIPKKERKVKIDKRFQSMFTNKKFNIKYTIDKRGRPANNTSGEDLKKYYDLSSSGESDTSEEEERNGNYKTKLSNTFHNSYVHTKQSVDAEQELEESCQNDSVSESESEKEITFKVNERLQNMSVDYARGEGTLMSDSSSEDTSDETGSDEELDHGWGELDRDAEQTDEITNRLAVCNMDWDRIRASDLMVLFNSFLPSGGLIQSVTIYPSEFGLKRMEEEEIKGPIELCNEIDLQNEQDSGSGEEAEEGSRYHMEKLRQYQLNRLKYYYAVVVCDSASTANKVYCDCDGLEYESSATKLDLRFVPQDTTFHQEPREVCTQLPELAKYQPLQFTTTALQQAKVELTWDETDVARAQITQKLMSGQTENIDDADLHAYLATSSGEEEDDEEEKEVKNNKEAASLNNEDDTSMQGKKDPISVFRMLLKDMEEQEEKKKNQDVEMELTWGVGLKDKTEQLVQKKLKGSTEGLTPFQQYLEKRKVKKQEKRKEKKKNLDSEEDDNNPFSDDDIPSDIDMNDPYFKEEFQNNGPRQKKKEKKKNKKDVSDDEESKLQKAELELLLMTNAEDKGHFSMKAIQEQEEKKKKKSKWRKKSKKMAAAQQTNQDVEDFEVNVKDERFSALFSSHHFNIDPADPHYRKTKGIEALREEKLKRRQNEDTLSAKVPRRDSLKKQDPELTMLVKSIKRNTHKPK